MANKFEIPFFRDPTKNSEELAELEKKHSEVNEKIAQERQETTQRKEGTVEVLDAIMRNPKLTKQLFKTEPEEGVVVLDDIPAEQDEKKRGGSGIDGFVVYEINGKKVIMPVKAEPFDFIPNKKMSPSAQKLATEEFGKRLQASYDQCAEQTIQANKKEVSGPIVSLKFPRENIGDLLSATLSDLDDPVKQPEDKAVFKDNDAKKMEGFFTFLRNDIKRQLSRMLANFFNEYAHSYCAGIPEKVISEKMASFKREMAAEATRPNANRTNNFLTEADDFLKYLDRKDKEDPEIIKQFNIDTAEKNNLRGLIENTIDILKRHA
ncbi:MAG: hypothetical protein WCV41_04760 [Patescibacteria group bacterium]